MEGGYSFPHRGEVRMFVSHQVMTSENMEHILKKVKKQQKTWIEVERVFAKFPPSDRSQIISDDIQSVVMDPVGGECYTSLLLIFQSCSFVSAGSGTNFKN